MIHVARSETHSLKTKRAPTACIIPDYCICALSWPQCTDHSQDSQSTEGSQPGLQNLGRDFFLTSWSSNLQSMNLTDISWQTIAILFIWAISMKENKTLLWMKYILKENHFTHMSVLTVLYCNFSRGFYETSVFALYLPIQWVKKN